MSKPGVFLFFAILAALLPGTAGAAETSMTFGGDSYAAGDVVVPAEPIAHDAFAAGRTVTLTVPVTGNAHLAGFDVHATGNIGGSFYGAGYTVTVNGSVGRDLTAAGNSVVVNTTAPLAGNARLAGASITVGSEVDGSLLVTGGTLTLTAPVKGDLSFYGESIQFGPNAQVAGQVQIHAPAQIAVPATVAPADRVAFTQMTMPQYQGAAETMTRGFGANLWTAAVWWLVLFLVGLAFLAWGRRMVGELEVLSEVKPFGRFWLGILALATVIGLIPLAAMTLIGIVVVPLVLIFAFVVFVLSYIAGVYLVGFNLTRRFAPSTALGGKAALLAGSIIVAGLLARIPFIGWIITMILTAYGLGVVAADRISRWGSSDRARLAAPPPATATPA